MQQISIKKTQDYVFCHNTAILKSKSVVMMTCQTAEIHLSLSCEIKLDCF